MDLYCLQSLWTKTEEERAQPFPFLFICFLQTANEAPTQEHFLTFITGANSQQGLACFDASRLQRRTAERASEIIDEDFPGLHCSEWKIRT